MPTPEEIFAKRTLSESEKIDEANGVFARLQAGEIDRETAENEVNFLMKGMSAQGVNLLEERWKDIENDERRMSA